MMTHNQAPGTVMMVRPSHFGYNPETAASNSFQKADDKEDLSQIRRKANQEFDGLVAILKSSGVEVIVYAPNDGLETPDAVFPNNWVSFHQDGKVILYPMMAPSRRLERRIDVITTLDKNYGFTVDEIIDLSYFENQQQYLEGTGSMVLDYHNRIIYANHSPRTSMPVLNEAARLLKFKTCSFDAVDDSGLEIYHTNVLMCIGSGYSVVCIDSLKDQKDKINLEKSLESTGHEIINISYQQLQQFAGNMMELRNDQGKSILAMSENAYKSLTDQQRDRLSSYAELVYAPIDTIERLGGGSVRCMLAGVFLPRG